MKAWVVAAVLPAQLALANAPETSSRPELRPADAPAPAVLQGSSRPAETSTTLDGSLRPEMRPPIVERRAREARQLAEKGAVCGDIDIQGEVVGRVPGRLNGCGVESAVRVRQVSGVGLSVGAVMECGTAKALKSWVEATARPTLAKTGGGLQRLRVAAHYACRTRNNQPDARISEHGRGRAIDISAFEFRNGQEITVLDGWQDRRSRQLLQRLQDGACGPFTTVLGPEADRFHKDHFHFDTARRRGGGRYCR